MGKPKGVLRGGTWPARGRPGPGRAVPFPTVFGVHVALTTLTVGGTLVLQDRFEPHGALDLLEREQVSVCHGVPTMFQLLMREPSFGSRTLSAVRTA